MKVIRNEKDTPNQVTIEWSDFDQQCERPVTREPLISPNFLLSSLLFHISKVLKTLFSNFLKRLIYTSMLLPYQVHF